MTSTLNERVSTGIEGLDDVLQGGLVPRWSYMLRGRAGSGKTVLGLHFLEAGIPAGETGLFVNLEEDLADLEANAAALGFETDAIEFPESSGGRRSGAARTPIGSPTPESRCTPHWSRARTTTSSMASTSPRECRRSTNSSTVGSNGERSASLADRPASARPRSARSS